MKHDVNKPIAMLGLYALLIVALSTLNTIMPFWVAGSLVFIAAIALARQYIPDAERNAVFVILAGVFSTGLVATENITLLSFTWVAAFAFLGIVALVLSYMKITEQRYAWAVLVLFIIISVCYSFFYSPAVAISRGQGTVLSDNWFVALNWMRNNTKECATVATYWDPGHFIRAIAHRSVVFDGGSQNYHMTVQDPGAQDKGLSVEKHDNGINRVILEKNGTITTARIQDISSALLTSNETLAVATLRKYRNNCDEMYFIASADLIGKSQWWSYFATWDPGTSSGQKYVYLMVPLSQARPLPTQDTIAYTYPLGQNQAFVIFEANSTLSAFLQQGNHVVKVEKIFYFTRDGRGVLITAPDAEVKGLLWVDPTQQLVVFMQPELQNSMFTKMYFFNGQGLDKFELVGSWGGEVKLFKVKFD
ncbi:MAG: hypothetical protein HYY37_01760 [Candidatus Aenigmarchaeota archaeon]|nr:hypothetical protein [Candidatus Aenigmarchaeota archaeon]